MDRKSSHRFSLLETGHSGYFYIAHSLDLESMVYISAISWNDLIIENSSKSKMISWWLQIKKIIYLFLR